MEAIKIQMTKQLIEEYSQVSGDVNPIHLSKKAAHDAGYPKEVAHGMLSMAISTSLISPYLEGGWVLAMYRVKFTSPLFVWDHLVIDRELVASDEEAVKLKILGNNQHGERILQGKIELVRKSRRDMSKESKA